MQQIQTMVELSQDSIQPQNFSLDVPIVTLNSTLVKDKKIYETLEKVISKNSKQEDQLGNIFSNKLVGTSLKIKPVHLYRSKWVAIMIGIFISGLTVPE